MLADAAFPADPKFLRLARNAASPAAYAAAVGVFWIVLADCRRARSPSVNWDDYEDYAEQVAMLQAVRLFTTTGFHPAPFEKYAPVYQSPFDRSRGKKDDGVPPTTQDDTEQHASTQVDTHIGYAGLSSTKSILSTDNGNARAKADERPVLSVACGECGVSVGEPCKGVRALRNGEEWERWSVHRSRWDVYRAVGGLGGLPDENDSATIACRLMFDGGKWLGNKEYVEQWDDMDRRFTAEWVQAELPAAYQACAEARSDGRVRPYDLRRMVEQRCAERARGEENARQRSEKQQAALAEIARNAHAVTMTDEEKELQSLYRKATRIWTQGGMVEEVPEDVEKLRQWVAVRDDISRKVASLD